MSNASDLSIVRLSQSLKGMTIDLAVGGSISATECVKLIRQLRRLSATIQPILTKGAAKFITELSLSWAAGTDCIKEFTGNGYHLGERDALVISGCSASTIAKIAHGICDEPHLSLASSYIGQRKPIILIPAMHDSLRDSPILQKNLSLLSPYVSFIWGKVEEGKSKFPNYEYAANEISHLVNRHHLTQDGKPIKNILITMGSSKGFIDQVRYISNYSSGKLGSMLSEELYRNGLETTVLVGSCLYKPKNYNKKIFCETNTDFEKNIIKLIQQQKIDAAVFLAALLDFIPDKIIDGKIKSQHYDTLNINLVRAKKLISLFKDVPCIKIGFKFESKVGIDSINDIFSEYKEKYNLNAVVFNQIDEVSSEKHSAYVIDKKINCEQFESMRLNSKMEIAEELSKHLSSMLYHENTNGLKYD